MGDADLHQLTCGASFHRISTSTFHYFAFASTTHSLFRIHTLIMTEHLAAFAVLGAQALVPIAVGSFQSLRIPASVRARKRAARRARTKLGEDDDDILDENEGETLTLADSILFPVLGSAALLALWALITYVDPRVLDVLLGCYCESGPLSPDLTPVSVASAIAVQSTLDGVLHFLLRAVGAAGPTYHVRVSAGIKRASMRLHQS